MSIVRLKQSFGYNLQSAHVAETTLKPDSATGAAAAAAIFGKNIVFANESGQ